MYIVSSIALAEAAQSATELSAQYEGVMYKTIGSLFLLFVIAFVVVFLYKRMNTSQMTKLNEIKMVKIIESRALSPKTMLHVVEVNKKQILLSESQNDVRSHGSFDSETITEI